jgi:peptidoglycan/xylan/chitin deacetylase (PgdA/CDA1 family)
MTLVVTTSWDDGYPADMKLADLLAKHGARGTFYIPNRNAEGRPVVAEGDLKRLAATFEIGGHSVDHVVLTGLPRPELERQIRDNKAWIEGLTGRRAPCFCYVRGNYDRLVKDVVREAGFDFARTVAAFSASVGLDPLEVPTTLQFFPHRAVNYVKMFRRGPKPDRVPLLLSALAGSDLEKRIDRLAEMSATRGGYFHLWGHSWELEQHDLWPLLDRVLRQLAARHVRFATNHEAFAGLGPPRAAGRS